MFYAKRRSSTILILTLTTILCGVISLSMGADAWWPERAQFKPTGGAFREKLSPEKTYVYDASDAKLIVPGDSNALADAKADKYADGAEFVSIPGETRAAWTLGKIPAGKYWLGVQVHSGDEKWPDLIQSNWAYITRVNGMAYDFTSMTGPVNVANESYASEMLSANAIDLKEGDRVTVMGNYNLGFVGKLTLYTTQPKRGPIFRTPGFLTSGRADIWDSKININLKPAGQKSAAEFFIRNTANAAQELKVDIRVVDYFGKAVATNTQTVTLKDLAGLKGQVEFDTGDSPRYRVTMTIRGLGGLEKTTSASVNAEVSRGKQQTASLDGQWQQTRVPDVIEIGQAPDDKAQWMPYYVPGMMQFGGFKDLPPGLKDIHVGWAKRTFEVPERMKGQRIFLNFERLAEEAVVYVNGKKVGGHYGLYFPEEFDITSVVHPGANELLVGIRDTICYIDPVVLKANGPKDVGNCFAQGIAPSFAHHYGQNGILGHARLVSRGEVAVTDAYAATSTRKGEISLEITVTNSSAAPRKVSVQPVVKDAGKDALTLKAQDVEVPAGGSKVVRFASAFANPHCWFLEDPHFYELSVSLLEDGKAVDESRTRFGFKEFYAKDGLFTLNGRPAKVSSMPRAEGGSFNRHTAPSVDDLMENDERGYMTSFAAPWCVGPREFNLDSDLYWKNSEEFARQIIHGLRGHPSISMWEASNEFFCFCFTIGSSVPGGAIHQGKVRLQHLGETIRQADPTRMVLFSSDGDLDGWNDLCSLHYPRDNEPLTRSSTSYIPDAYFWRPLNKPFTIGQDLPVESGASFPMSLKYRAKPIMMDEIGQFSINVADDPTIVGGEEPYRSHVSGCCYWQSVVDGYILDGARDLEASHYQPWSHAEQMGTSVLTMPLRCVLPLDYMGQWRSGQEACFQANIHHDILWPEKMTVRWELRDADGKTLLKDTLADREFAASELLRTQIKFTLPTVDKDTRCRFVTEVLCDGKVVFSRDKGFVIYPAKVRAVTLTKRFGLFDPAGKAAKAMDLLGAKPAKVESIDEAALAGLDVLLVGPDAVTTAEAADKIAAPVQAFVAKGGRVVVFEHDQPVRWMPYMLNADKVRQTSFAFPRVSNHPILKGIELEDLRLWRDNRLVSRHDYLKPSRGACLPIIDAGGAIGLEWTPMLEVFFGQGSYVLSQMLLIGKADVDPCAAKLLANVLEYADGPVYRKPQSVALLATEKSPLTLLMDRLSADVKRVGPEAQEDLSINHGIIVDGSEEATMDRAPGVIEAAKAGSTVLVHRLTDKTVAAWAKALGARLELREINDYYRGRAVRADWSPLLEGLSMHEFHWHQSAGGDDSSFALNYRIAELAHTEIVTDAPGAVQCTHPAVFVSVPVGKGVVMFDQTNWDTAGDMVGNYSRRIASTLVTNMGGSFKAVPPARKVEGPLAYVPIDLSKFVNHPMADEVADDGEGGWSDQGPRIDGREFPTGRVMAKGIPFLIGGPKEVKPTDKSVIVLNGARFKKRCPEVDGIPVGLSAETLCFLHTAAWAGESAPIMSYIVHYDDATFEEIRVVSGINTNDWWLPTGDRDFLDEMPGVHTQVGLIAENPTFECAGVYLMEWINPHPQKKIATIDCVFRQDPDKSSATPIILGISVGVKADKSAPAQGPKGDTAQATALTKQAEELMAKNSYDQAVDLLQQALAADANFGRAAFMLGRCHRMNKKFPEATKAYRTAAGLLPESTELLNEFAQMLETQGKRIQASAVYRQSLRINWNQPPIMEAVNRLK